MDETIWVLVLLGAAILFGFFGLLIGHERGRAGFGLFMGIFFGPLGCLIVAVMGSAFHCPVCQQTIQRDARLCPHCHQALDWRGNIACLRNRDENPIDPDDWQNQNVTLDPRQAEWDAAAGSRSRT